ncbi:hypothetical protein BEN47_02275 [Hymenobacter lapidarius]|uniref:Uncharacterized protein n=1 Tax=Hymenobacter lapidarius TaxID=1908237 RepID=A0A1G1T2U3_9BACT|nr:hypothetical protein [Hymenobacter lapidarius]OGX85176.1 hypothetical protein BEN47_02275 [Hymenobacter lapidarius]
MPKLIDYPRTTYAGAWELAEITDDTGGKCAIETAARKLNRKVSGSFKAIIGSAVKFGLLTSKRDLLTTTTLFKRIKHAYDKQEELLFHREAFLTPPLFTQLCRKFRSRELPVQMLDVMLIREFGVEEINAQGVAKAFVEGCRMVGLLDERNIIADIDAPTNKPGPRRELASPAPSTNSFRPALEPASAQEDQNFDPSVQHTESFASSENSASTIPETYASSRSSTKPASDGQTRPDAIASLFGLLHPDTDVITTGQTSHDRQYEAPGLSQTPNGYTTAPTATLPVQAPAVELPQTSPPTYQIQVSGPGVNTLLSITDEDDIAIAVALLQKIKRQLNAV